MYTAGKTQLRDGAQSVVLNTDRPVLVAGESNEQSPTPSERPSGAAHSTIPRVSRRTIMVDKNK